MRFYGQMSACRERFPVWLAELAELDWVVYAKPPFGGPQQGIDYVGRYTHRVALSNQRLLDMEDDRVTFAYKDYRSGDRYKTRPMTVSTDEFIRRFLLHVLPSGFQRIRHYGILAGRNKQNTLAHCRRLLAADCDLLPAPGQIAALAELVSDFLLCPLCRQGRLERVETILKTRSPFPWDSS